MRRRRINDAKRHREPRSGVAIGSVRLLRHFVPRNDGFALLAMALLLTFFVLPVFAAAENQAGPAPNVPVAQASVAQKEAAPRTESSLDFANGLYARKMYGPAVSEYQKFILENPSSAELPSAHFRLADSYYYLRDYKSAVSQFDLFTKKFKNDNRFSTALFRLGTSRLYLNDSRKALRLFRRVSKSSPDPTLRAGSLFYGAKILDTKGRALASIRILKKLIQTYPQSEYAAYAGVLIGDVYAKEQKVDEALSAYQAALQKNSPLEIFKEASLKIAEIYFLKKDYAAAGKAYQDVFSGQAPEAERLKAFREKALLGLFYCDFYTKKLDFSLDRLSRHRAFVNACAYRAEILYLVAALSVEQKDFKSAVRYLDWALMQDALSDEWREKILFKKASALSRMNRKELALGVLKKILAYPSYNHAKAHLESAEILDELGNPEEAAAHYEAVLSQDSQSEAAKIAAPRALLYRIQTGLDAKKYEEVIQGVNDFVRDYSNSGLADIADYKMAVAFLEQKKFKEASEVFKTLINSFPSSAILPESLYGAGVSLENNEEPKDAVSYYEKLIAAFPAHDLSKEIRPRLGYLYVQMHEFEKAKLLYQDILFRRPEDKLETDAVIWLAQYLLEKRDYATMKNVLQIMPQRFPGRNLDHEMNFLLGESQMGLKDYPSAVAYYEKAIQTDPNGVYVPHAYLGIGIAQAALKDGANAEKNLNETLRYDQEIKVTMRARFEIANLRLRAGNLEEAAKAFMLVAILYDDPKYVPLALYKAGECFQSLKRTEEAQKAFTELKTRYPESNLAKRAHGAWSMEHGAEKQKKERQKEIG